MRLLCVTLLLMGGLAFSPALAADGPSAAESARQIPVAYDVDVVVVGGSTGGVAAAVAAAEAGAKVFLAAPRPYLGEDMCATMRLYLDEGETPAAPLARKVFAREGEAKALSLPFLLPFKYAADLPAVGRHPDTKPPSRLSDGVIGKPESDSVQFDGDVTITADLGSTQDVKEARLVAFQRAGDFEVGSLTVATSDDKKTWKDAGAAKVESPDGGVVTLAVPVNAKAQYVRLLVKRAAGVKRLLLAEVALAPSGGAAPAPAAGGVWRGPVRPMHVKKALDDALLAAKVDYLYSCYATEVLRDAGGSPCGIVMANRAGRQAVRAKVIIDATDRAWVARMTGAAFAPYPAGPQVFERVVVGGEVRSGEGVSGRKVGLSYGIISEPPKDAGKGKGGGVVHAGSADLIEYTLKIPMADGSWVAFARAEQAARDRTFSPAEQIDTDELFQVPPDPMKSVKAAAGDWKGAAALDLDAFRPAGVPRVFVLGGCADLPRDQAARLLRPCALMEMGQRVGAAAAAEAKAAGEIKEVRVAPCLAAMPKAGGEGRAPGDTREILVGVRPTQKNLPTVPSPDRSLPVLGTYDVVVVGGGTGGAPAGISAARHGARTLVVEYLHGLGGVGTLGMISKYYWGYREGFSKEGPLASTAWDPREKAEWWRTSIRKAGGEVWFGVLGCGALVEGDRVRGIVVATPQGRGVVLAKVVIDSTGNSDIAAAAGAETMVTGADELAVQGTGLPPIKLGATYTNTDFTLTDETDMMDVWHLFVYAKSKYETAFDLGQLIDTRERRRIVGDFTMTYLDQLNGRTFPDTVNIGYSNFDSHGYTTDPYTLLKHPDKGGVTANVPYRCLLPKGLDGILVTGLGISVHRDALPVTRMQADIQNQGYAAGLIAADVAKGGRSTRSVDIRDIQRQLVKLGILPESVLKDADSYPLPAAKVAEAVASLKDDYKGASVVMAQPRDALPLLKKAYAAAKGEPAKLIYAHTLAVLGDATGLETLLRAVDAAKWDQGWNYTGMGQFGMSLSRLDTYLVALGRTHDKRALPAILKKAAQLDANAEFSHHRVVALALEAIGDPSAAPVLAELLSKPGMIGYANTSVEKARQLSGSKPGDNNTRTTSLRELFLARALYRCGDKGGLGKKILTEYTQDLRGHLARHAQAVLDEKK